MKPTRDYSTDQRQFDDYLDAWIQREKDMCAGLGREIGRGESYTDFLLRTGEIDSAENFGRWLRL